MERFGEVRYPVKDREAGSWRLPVAVWEVVVPVESGGEMWVAVWEVVVPAVSITCMHACIQLHMVIIEVG